MESKLEEAIKLRSEGKPEEALIILKDLLATNPNDPKANYQTAWTYDSMGDETSAVIFYEAAIKKNLPDKDLDGAYIGLGSTYRCLGRHEDSLKTLDEGIKKFPKNRALKVFKALTLYSLNKFGNCTEELLLQLIETTSDKNINSYKNAFKFYSDKLAKTWC